jgi:aryl-alcohol dehydrogenase-like predicted oxidoreductase
METRQLGTLWPVSALTLGGGGLGQIWGPTTREEAVATAKAAVDAGITLIDLAPMYGRGEAEAVIGEAFGGKLPGGVRVTTKCQLGNPGPGEVVPKFEKHLTRSLKALKMERVDLFFLHSNIAPDDYTYARYDEVKDRFVTPWSVYLADVIPVMEDLKARGLIGAWGITGTGLPKTIMEALRHEPKPAAVQAVANLMDSAGDMRQYEEPAEPRNIIRTAKANEVGVMGIRAVATGALTAELDRPLPTDDATYQDYQKAAPYRALCAELGEDPALLAHRYALSMEGVDTVILGVKNRDELKGVVEAEAQGPLPAEVRGRIDALKLNFQMPRLPLDGEPL